MVDSVSPLYRNSTEIIFKILSQGEFFFLEIRKIINYTFSIFNVDVYNILIFNWYPNET